MFNRKQKKHICKKRQRVRDNFARRTNDFWGENVKIVEWITHDDYPYRPFEIRAMLYKKHEILFEYEIDDFSINIKVNDIFISLHEFTDEKIAYGGEDMASEITISKFEVLDRILTTNYEELEKAVIERWQKEKDNFEKHVTDFWGQNVEIVEWIIHDEVRYQIIEFRAILYKKHELSFEYQSGQYSICIKVNNKFEYLDELAKKLIKADIIYGVECMQPENIISNFTAFDKTLKMIAEYD